MAANKLKRILRRTNGELIRYIIDRVSGPVRLVDENGQVFHENDTYRQQNLSLDMRSFPIEFEQEVIGHVLGESDAELVRRIVDVLVSHESNNKALGNETLNLYREINLLYNLADKLGKAPEVEYVARTALDEASRLIDSTAGAIYLKDSKNENLINVGKFGSMLPDSLDLTKQGTSLIKDIFTRGKSEIIIDVPEDARRDADSENFRSMIGVPLAASDQILGLIILANESLINYTAADLKLVQSVASQTTPAIESAQRYENAIAEAMAREERLQRQIQELKIELDEMQQARQVAEITETDYFKDLRGRASDLRKLFDE